MIVLSEADGWELWICRIAEEPDSGALSLCALVCLGLPPLAEGASITSSYCIRRSLPVYSDLASFMAEGRPRGRLPFCSSPDAGVVAIVAGINASGTAPDQARLVTIASPLHKLVALATTAPPQLGIMTWKDWGPCVTVCFKTRYFSCGEYGESVAMGERLWTYLRVIIFLYGLNTMRVQDAIRESRDAFGMRAKVVHHGTTIPGEKIYKRDVVSELPHISIDRPIPSFSGAPVSGEGGIASITLLSQHVCG